MCSLRPKRLEVAEDGGGRSSALALTANLEVEGAEARVHRGRGRTIHAEGAVELRRTRAN